MLNVKLESVLKALNKAGWKIRACEHNDALLFAGKPGVEDGITIYKSENWRKPGELICTLLEITSPRIPAGSSPTFASSIKQALEFAK
jgi:hypothetical protein